MKLKLKLDYKSHNNNVEFMKFRYNLGVQNVLHLNESTIIDRLNWTSGTYPNILPASFKEK